jgi:hypothetical protein
MDLGRRECRWGADFWRAGRWTVGPVDGNPTAPRSARARRRGASGVPQERRKDDREGQRSKSARRGGTLDLAKFSLDGWSHRVLDSAGAERDLRSVRNMEFLHDVAKVNLHRALRDAELKRDDLVLSTFP